MTLSHHGVGTVFESIDQSWVTAGHVVGIQANWAVALSALGVLSLTLATGWALAGDVIRTSTAIQSVARGTENRQWIAAVVGSEMCLPLVTTAAMAAGAYYFLALGLTTGATYVTPSPTYVALVSLTGLGVGILASTLVASLILRPGLRADSSR